MNSSTLIALILLVVALGLVCFHGGRVAGGDDRGIGWIMIGVGLTFTGLVVLGAGSL